MSSEISNNGLSEEEVIRILSSLVSESSKLADSGACIYTAGAKTYCAALSKSDCDALKGSWTEGGKCP